MLLCDKYAPTTLNSVVGNSTAINFLMNFAVRVQSGGRVKPLIIYGPTGSGKTAAAHALAYSNGFELLELNASDYRDAETFRSLLIPAGSSNTLFGGRIMILLDEIDELSVKLDSGAEKAILELMKVARNPIVFIANDYWDRKISFLRDKAEKCEFRKPNASDVKFILDNIVLKEGKAVDEKIITAITDRSNGDIRGAVNDLDMAIDGGTEIMECMGARDRKQEIFGVLDKIFFSGDFYTARNAVNSSDIDTEMLLNWVEENIPVRYLDRRSTYDAFEEVAAASQFLENAHRKGVYDLLRYAAVHLSAGVSLAGRGNLSRLKSYSFPYQIRYMSKNKKDRDVLGHAIIKVMQKHHSSKSDARHACYVLLKKIMEKSTEAYGAERVEEFFEFQYGLAKEEVESIRSMNS